MADDAGDRADDTADPGAATADPGTATAPSNGLGGGETTPPPDPNAAATTATNGGEITRATGPEAGATTATNGGEVTDQAEPENHRALHDYAARYSGRTLVARLLFIARRCGVEAIELEALGMALREARKGKDVFIYGDICNAIGARLGPIYDQAWVDGITEEYNMNLLFIEADLKSQKESQLLDMVRTGYMELGDLYYSHGYVADAFKAYIQTEDYITAAHHLTQLCLNAILISIELGNFDRVVYYVSMAKGSPNPLDAITTAKLHAAAGLALLRKKEYKLAALQFLEIGTELGSNYCEVIAPNDVAVYGAFCALATFNSSEIKTKLLDNTSFGDLLGLFPDAWQLVHNFYHSQHTLCIEILDKMSSDLVFDCHFEEHIETLSLVITQKSGYMVFDNFSLDTFLEIPSPLQNEGDTEAHDNSRPLNVRSNLVLPDNFNDDLELVPSDDYSFVKCKDLLEALGKRISKWVPKNHSCALLQNADLFVSNSGDSEGRERRIDGRIALVSDEKFSLINVEFRSYTTTGRTLKERKLKDVEDSVIDCFEMKGDMWARRRTCLRANPGFHLLQWRKTSGLRRVQVQPQDAPPAENSRDTLLKELTKTLLEQLKETSKTVTEARQDIANSKEAIVEACKAAVAAMGSGVDN